MKKYEYDTVRLSGDNRLSTGSIEEKEFLNRRGNAGWMLCSVKISSLSFGDDVYYFVREVNPN